MILKSNEKIFKIHVTTESILEVTHV